MTNINYMLSSSKCCLVTVCIGQKYIDEYNKLFRSSQEAYAKKCGYDFKMITEFLTDKKHKNLINMHKWLVCSQKWSANYDYIIYIDADIVINKNTPPLHNAYDFGFKIGIVNESQPTLDAMLEVHRHRGFGQGTQDYYKIHTGVRDTTFKHIINSGVIVFQPKIHADYLERLIYKYQPSIMTQPPSKHKDQPFFGYQLQIDEMYYYMDMKWNAIWETSKYYFNTIKHQPLSLQEYYDRNYFVHFAGHSDYHVIPSLKL